MDEGQAGCVSREIRSSERGLSAMAMGQSPSGWIRSPIDVNRTKDAILAGEQYLMAHDKTPTLQAVIFTLLQEATQTERAEKGVGPRGHISAMPEVYHTANEIFATEIEMIADKISYEPDNRPVVSAAAAARYMEVTKWLRFARGRDRKQSKQLLWLLAKGLAPGAVARIVGLPNARAVGMAKTRRLNEIAEEIERQLKKAKKNSDNSCEL